MNWAIHTKGPTAAADLRAALESEMNALLGSEETEAARQEQIATMKAAADGVPAGQVKDALIAAHAALAAELPSGIADKTLRMAIAGQAAVGISAACSMASGATVAVTVSGSAGRVDEDVLGRCSVSLDFVDIKGMAARLARETPAERPVVTEGSIFAPAT